jgi:hypothetical protein
MYFKSLPVCTRDIGFKIRKKLLKTQYISFYTFKPEVPNSKNISVKWEIFCMSLVLVLHKCVT